MPVLDDCHSLVVGLNVKVAEVVGVVTVAEVVGVVTVAEVVGVVTVAVVSPLGWVVIL